MKKYYLIQFAVLILLFVPTQGLPQNILACNGDIIKINLNNCSQSLICHDTMAFSDIAIEGGVLYGIGSHNLFTIDTVTGFATLIAYSSYGGLTGLTGDGAGHLYAASVATTHMICEYDIASGVFSYLGVNGYTCPGDLAFKNGELYELGQLNSDTIYLVHINLNPFYSTSIGPLNICGTAAYGLVNIDQNDKNSLIASVVCFDSLGFGSDNLYRIDITNAAVTLICSTNFNGILGLTNVSGGINGIPQIEWKNNFTVYPNPASDEIEVSNGQDAISSIEIYNLLGEKVYTISNIKRRTLNEIDISSFPGGVYFMEVRTEKGIDGEKIIKE